MSTLARLLFGLALLFAPVARASVLNIGLISFDVLIPGGPGSPGVNVFNISNLTGDPAGGGFALPPDFPAATPLVFRASKLTLAGDSSQTVDLGDVGPGPLGSIGALQFPANVRFSSAIFSATLNTTHILLLDGSTFVAASPSVITRLLPSVGFSLVAGADFALITVNDIPEPATLGLVLAGFGALAGIRKRRTLQFSGSLR